MLTLLCIVVLAVALVPLTSLGAWTISQRSATRKLASLECVSCGRPFGQCSAASARKDHLGALEAYRREHPHARIDPLPEWSVQCPNCDATFNYNFDERRLLPSRAGTT